MTCDHVQLMASGHDLLRQQGMHTMQGSQRARGRVRVKEGLPRAWRGRAGQLASMHQPVS